MIVYRLHCSNGHRFEGWFASGEAYSSQRAEGLVACPSCDDRAVEKLPSAPYVNTGRSDALPTTAPAASPEGAAGHVATVISAVKAFILANTEDVGRRFPEVARRIHYGEESHRGVRGHVTDREAAELLEEGIEAIPLPSWLVVDEPVQ